MLGLGGDIFVVFLLHLIKSTGFEEENAEHWCRDTFNIPAMLLVLWERGGETSRLNRKPNTQSSLNSSQRSNMHTLKVAWSDDIKIFQN